ncbi:MAG TPA: nuclear transport factor 2 family protein [Gammaproteobacteria bacterium]|nr:nuclear transport factor 2 family protein [Gammaproteobacteria bacterium]
MRKPIALMLVCLALSGAAAAGTVSLVQNEYAFARDVAAHGIRDGFLMHLDKQSVTFAPQPVNAYDFYTQRKPGSSKLSWYPTFALVSASGDFGVDTGPWTADWTQDGKAQSAHGEWLSVWARDGSGAWRALFDGGVSHPAPTAPAQALDENSTVTQLPASKDPAPSTDEVQSEIQRQETLFSNDAVNGLKAAYSSVAAEDIRLLLEGAYPLVGRETVLKAMPETPAGLQWVPMGNSVAKTGDLGYVYGMTYKSTDEKHETPQGVYMHVWRRDAEGWKLVIAEEVPLAQPSK